METPKGITKEEHFAYLVSSGASKSEAYRTLFPDEQGYINVKAWRYANSPQVIHMLAHEADNLYVKYNKARSIALDTLLDLTMNASSEKVQSDSAIGLLNQTTKMSKQIDISVTNNDFAESLEQLRSVLLTPHSVSSEHNKSLSNANSNSEKFLEAAVVVDSYSILDENFSKLEAFKACGVKYIVGNRPLTLQVLNDQQFDSINPLSSRDGDLNARITDTDTGRFVSYGVARRYLEEQDYDSVIKTDDENGVSGYKKHLL